MDADPAHGGDETIHDQQAEHGEFPPTPQQATRGGGWHYVFAYPEAETIRNSAGRLGPGVDIRGDGGYIVAAPSRHASGGLYTWDAGAHPADTPLAPPPDWLINKLREPERAPTDVVDGDIPEGERNATLARFAGAMRRPGMTEKSILAALEEETASGATRRYRKRRCANSPSAWRDTRQSECRCMGVPPKSHSRGTRPRR